MGYRSNVAAGRQNPASDSIANEPKPSKTASNQERLGGSKARNISTASNFNIGNQVRIQGNTKGTGTFGVTSAVALAKTKRVGPASENPDGKASRGGKYR